MPVIDILKETKVSNHPRIQMLGGMFDCPIDDANRFELHADIDTEGSDWNIGLIVGPSGCGKSSVLECFGKHSNAAWDETSIVTSFDSRHEVKSICAALSSVGLNNIRAWMRPYHVLSNGERFRADCARAILEQDDPILIDEFTSVVDRQVAKIASHAVQKYCRKTGKKMVVASCHYDIVDWLQPDWYFEPHKNNLVRRSLRRRPDIAIEIRETKHSDWKMFAPYHYLNASLHKAAKCYMLLCEGIPATFAGILFRPVSAKGAKQNVYGISRVVTLPDFQGIGLAFVLMNFLAEKYRQEGNRLRMYPAHPSLVRSFERSPVWVRTKDYGKITSRNNTKTTGIPGLVAARMNAVYEYVGEKT